MKIKFKIRASACHHLMTADDLKPKEKGSNLTEKQEIELKDFQERDKPLTPKMLERKKYLIEKRDKKPELTQGAKTYLKSWLKEQKEFYGVRKEIKSKYLEKGNICEDTAIQFLNDVLLEDYEKNTVRKENDWMTGECDIHRGSLIRDIKNSFEPDTFPLFEEYCSNDYYWQCMTYMCLYDCTSAAVDYFLMDAPDHIIYGEAKRLAYNDPSSPVTDDLINQKYQELLPKMTFGHVDPKLRIKSFYFNRDEQKINLIKERVEMAQEYINSLVKGVFGTNA